MESLGVTVTETVFPLTEALHQERSAATLTLERFTSNASVPPPGMKTRLLLSTWSSVRQSMVCSGSLRQETAARTARTESNAMVMILFMAIPPYFLVIVTQKWA